MHPAVDDHENEQPKSMDQRPDQQPKQAEGHAPNPSADPGADQSAEQLAEDPAEFGAGADKAYVGGPASSDRSGELGCG
jgi:hypothetical protein